MDCCRALQCRDGRRQVRDHGCEGTKGVDDLSAVGCVSAFKGVFEDTGVEEGVEADVGLEMLVCT